MYVILYVRKFCGILFCLSACLSAGLLSGQVGRPTITFVRTDPSGACANTAAMQYNYILGSFWGCKNSVWTMNSGGGVAGVVSFNSRVGGVSLLTADITALGTLSNRTTGAAGRISNGSFNYDFSGALTSNTLHFSGAGSDSYTTVDVFGDPSGGCTSPEPLQYNNTNGKLWGCDGSVWTQISGSGGGGVLTFNTRAGAVTLLAADVNAVGGITNNTSGNAATATTATTAGSLAGTPSLCTTGQAPTGILANGNATGCAAIGSGGVTTFNTRAGAVTLLTADVNAVGAITNSTSGNAATATALAATPSLCTTGQAPTGVLANGNATGCASIGGGGGSPGGSTDDVQYKTSGGAFGGGRCTMSSANVMTCAGGYAGGTGPLTFGGQCTTTGSVAVPPVTSPITLNYFCNSANSNHLTSKDSSSVLVDIQAGGSGPTLNTHGGDFVFGTPDAIAAGVVVATSGSANSGSVLGFINKQLTRTTVNYQINAAGGGGAGLLFGIYSADLTTALCISTVGTGSKVTTANSPQSLTWASGANVSGGVCTIPLSDADAMVWTSDDTTLSLFPYADSNKYPMMTVNSNIHAGWENGLSTGTGASLAFVGTLPTITHAINFAGTIILYTEN